MKNQFNELFAPTIVLVSICLIAALLLAATYQITEPLIVKINLERANAARATVLPEASGFVEAKNEELVSGVLEVYESVNGVGYVITSEFKGFGGPVIVMTGLDPKGSVVGVTVTDASSETPGLGSKATHPSYLDQYIQATQITSDASSAEATYVAAVTGATVTSRAVFSAVSVALQQFAELGGDF